jgi:hypothetical protein
VENVCKEKDMTVSGLGADPDPQFPVQKMQGKQEKLGRGGGCIFFGGGGGDVESPVFVHFTLVLLSNLGIVFVKAV